MPKLSPTFLLIVLGCWLFDFHAAMYPLAQPRSAFASQPDWNQFRGPTGDGRSPSPHLPTEWSETENVRWKTAIPGKAWSSPVVLNDTIWLANATEDGKQLSALMIDAADGTIKKEIVVFDIAEPMYCHPFNSYASPTPVAAAGRIWVHYGSAGTACLDAATGKIIWSRQDLPCDHHRGPGSSPILFEDLLILTFDGYDQQYVTALNRDTGESVWRTDRTTDYGSDDGDMKKAYCTPTVLLSNDQPQLVCPGAVATIAYDPHSGEELWTVYHGGFNAAARPLFSHGLVIICTAGGDHLVAVRPNGRGDVTADRVAWTFGKAAPTRPSQSVVGDHLFMVNDKGIFSCLNIETGAACWSERHTGRYSASLIEAGRRLYACDEDGNCVIFKANPDGFEILAENSLDAGCMASPAVIENDILIRTTTHLYRISDR